MTEQWRPITGYEDRYEVSNKGRVRVLKSRVNILPEPKILNPDVFSKSQTSYERVQLSNPRKRFLVHRLVATEFLEKPEGCDVVNHIDNNGLNNSVNNLEWGTQSTNLKHAQKQGRLTEAQRKGGINQSIKARANALAEADSLVGTKRYSWTIVKNLGFSVVGTKGVERIRFEIKCDCGNTKSVDRFYFLSNRFVPTCKVCR